MKYHILVAVLALIGFSSAYAIETSVDVPFDSWIDTNCALQDNGNFMCVWVPDGGTVIIPPAETTEETVDEVVEVIPEDVISEPVVQMTREEKDIQRTIDRIEQDLIEDREGVPNADKQLLILLKRAQSECYFGVEQGRPIQAYALFGIPDGFLYIDDTDFAKNSQLGKIAKLIEACRGWDKYRVSHLGEQYSDIADANEAVTQETLDRESARQLFVNAILANVTKTDEFMNKAISEHDILEEAEEAQDYKCSVLGKQRGFCPEGIGEIEYVHDVSENPAMLKYQQYRDDPDNAVGEPKYSVSTNAKCYTLESFSKQYELDEESRRNLLEAAGCRL